MKHEFTENVKTTNSWSELESTVCMKKVVTSTTTADSVGDSKDINESEIVDDISDDDDEYDDEDDDDEDDDNTEVVTNDSLIAQELDVIKGLNERILDRKYFQFNRSDLVVVIYRSMRSECTFNPTHFSLALFQQLKKMSWKDVIALTLAHTIIWHQF